MKRKAVFSICRSIVILFGLSLCLGLRLFPAEGSEFSEFTSELSTLPLPASAVTDLDDALTNLNKNAQELKIDLKTEAVVDSRLLQLTSIRDTLEKQILSSADAEYAQLLKNVIAYYRNYRANLKDLADLSPRYDPLSSPPYTIEEKDTLRFALHKTFTDIGGDWITSRHLYDKAGAQLNELKNDTETRDSMNSPSALARELEEIDFASLVVDYQISLRDLKNEFALLKAQRDDLARMRSDVKFEEAELTSVLSLLDERLEQKRKQKEIIDAKQDEAESDYFRQKEFFEGLDPKDIIPRSGSSLAFSRLARSYLQYVAYSAWVQTHGESQARLREEKELWKARFDFHNGAMTRDRIWQTREKLHKNIQMAVNLRAHELYLFQSNYALALQRLKNTRDRASGEIRANLDVAVLTIEEILTAIGRDYSPEEQQHLLFLFAFAEELEENLAASKYLRQLETLWQTTRDSVWNAAVWEGDGYIVTVRKLIGALVIVFVGFYVSSWLSRFLAKHMRTLSAKSETLLILLQHIFFYSLLCVFILFALRVVHIPLTAFALVGGSIAVGFGFGMQTVCANLFGGIVIMTTQPFKLRDIVEIGEHCGTVSEISSRSTVIQCFDETEVVIPNRYFMENRFTNWTRKSPMRRYPLNIVTSLDADPEEVRRLILEAIASDSRIASHPAPWVCLKDCSYTGLVFEAYFWLDVLRHTGLQVTGALREKLLAALKARGWTCRWGAFPATLEQEEKFPKR